MFGVVQYSTNAKRKNQTMRMCGYFADYEKATDVAIKKAYDTMPAWTDDCHTLIHGCDMCDVTVDTNIQLPHPMFEIIRKYTCVAFPEQLDDDMYDNFIRDLLNPSGDTTDIAVNDLFDSIKESGCNHDFKKEWDKDDLQDTVANQKNKLNTCLTRVIADRNFVDYCGRDYLPQDEMVAFVSKKMFAVVEFRVDDDDSSDDDNEN